MMKKLCNVYLVTALSIFAILMLYYLQAGIFESFEEKTYDLRVRMLHSPHPSSQDIAIIEIDDKSIAELGRFPFSRANYSELLDQTRKAGARAVLFDAFFPEAQSESIDNAFAAAVRRSGNVTLAGGFDFAADGTVKGFTSNIPVLEKAAKRIAQVNMLPDMDGVIRSSLLLIPYEGAFYPSLGICGAAELLGAGKIDAGRRSVLLGDREVPTDREHRMLIKYNGPPGTYLRYSFADVSKGRVAAGNLRGKVLFVGATALGVYDMRVTPFSNNSPGVEVHANIADSIANGRTITRGVTESLLDIGLIIFMGVITSIISWKLRHLVSLPLVSILVLLHAGLASWVFLQGRWISIVYPAISIFFVSATVAYLRFFIVDRHAREIKAMFSSYVTQRLVDEMIKNPEMARLGGEKRDITVLFSDIKSFTTYSENHKPEEVVAILNEYLDEMTDIILKWEGILDKFIGDAIVVFWGAPLKQDDHAERALKCALEMQQRLTVLHGVWAAKGREPLFSAIGINTGEAIVGNIGSEGRKMDYTVIGDNVNLGARVEGLNRRYDTSILLTEYTVDRLRSSIEGGSLKGVSITGIERVIVKGKETPVGIFSVAPLYAGKPAELTECDPDKIVKLAEK